MLGGDPSRGALAALDDWDPELLPRWTADLAPVRVDNDGFSENLVRPGEGGSTGSLASPHRRWPASRDRARRRRASVAVGLRQTRLRESGGGAGALRGAVHREAAPAAFIHPPLDEGVLGVPRYTLSSQGAKVFARWGDPRTAWRNDWRDDSAAAQIIGIDLAAEGRLLTGFPLNPTEGWRWEGTPLAAGDCLYGAQRRQTALSVELAAVCLDIRDGAVRWRTNILSTTPLGQGRWNETSHHLLTLGDGVVYYNTHHGAVAALDAEDGQVQWLWTYPRTQLVENDPDQYRGFLLRDLTPCLLWRDLVVAAPADQTAVFALDSATGRMHWACEWIGEDAVHVHGVVGDQLVASGNHVYWLDAQTGLYRGGFPARQRQAPGHGLSEPRGHGRGVLTAEHFYWPTREHIYAFSANTRQSENGWNPVVKRVVDLAVRQAKGGNLIAAGGVMLIAAEDKLYAFP